MTQRLGTDGAQQGNTIRVKLTVLGKAPMALTDIPEGTTVGALLEQQGLAGREATVSGRVVGNDYVLKAGDSVLLKERLQAGQ